MFTQPLTLADEEALALYGLSGTALAAQCRHVRFLPRQWLCRAGQPLTHMLLLTQGRCRVLNTAGNGKLTLLGFYDGESRGLLGDMELLTTNDAQGDVQAVTEVHCIAVPFDLAQAELEHNLAFNRQMCRGIGGKFRLCCENRSMLLLTSLEERLCTYIHMTHEQGLFHENLTELADLLATSYRHLMRTMRALCDAGVLGRESEGRYRVLDGGYLARRYVDVSLMPLRTTIG